MRNVILLCCLAGSLYSYAQQNPFLSTDNESVRFEQIVDYFQLRPDSRKHRINSPKELLDSCRHYQQILQSQQEQLEVKEYRRLYYTKKRSLDRFTYQLDTFCKKYYQGPYLKAQKLNKWLSNLPYYDRYDWWRFVYILGILKNNKGYVDWSLRAMSSYDVQIQDKDHYLFQWVEDPNRSLAHRAYNHYSLLENLGAKKSAAVAAFCNRSLEFIFQNKAQLQKIDLKKIHPFDYSKKYEQIAFLSLLDLLLKRMAPLANGVSDQLRSGNYLNSLDDFINQELPAQTSNIFANTLKIYQQQLHLFKNQPEELKKLNEQRIRFCFQTTKDSLKATHLAEALRDHVQQFDLKKGYNGLWYNKDLAFLAKYKPYYPSLVDSLAAISCWKLTEESSNYAKYNLYPQYEVYLNDSVRVEICKTLANEAEAPFVYYYQHELLKAHKQCRAQNSPPGKVDSLYQLLLANPKLFEVKAGSFFKDGRGDTVITFDPETFEEIIHILPAFPVPTFYHFILNEYLERGKGYVKTDKWAKNEALWASAQQFTQQKYDFELNLDGDLMINAFQQILNYHLKEKEMDSLALLNWEFKRLYYLNKISLLETADSLHIQQLKDLYQYLKTYEDAHLIQEELVDMLERYGGDYERYPEHYPEKRWWWKEAKALAQQVYKNTGSRSILHGLKSLGKQKIAVIAEPYVAANTPFRIHTELRNIDSFELQIYKLTPTYKNRNIDLSWKVDSMSLQTWQFRDFNPSDLHTHVLELPMQPLAAGRYQIHLVYKDYQGSQHADDFELTVSSITPMLVLREDSAYYYFVDRNTGQPLANMEVHYQVYADSFATFTETTFTGAPDYKEKEIEVLKPIGTWEEPRYTDTQGRIAFPREGVAKEDNYGNVLNYKNKVIRLLLLHEEDSLLLDRGVHHNKYIKQHDTIARYQLAQLFSDRGIYRPGQQLHFKGILSDGRGEVLTASELGKDRLWAVLQLKSPSGAKGDTLHLLVNNWGSFSGEIELPLYPLGNYQLELTDLYYWQNGQAQSYDSPHRLKPSTHSFKVEEYKRPTFEVLLKENQSNYPSKGKIELSLSAQAFAGYPITEAAVEYKIERRIEDPGYWWLNWDKLYGRHNKKEQVWTTGVTTTDDQGEFILEFFTERYQYHNNSTRYYYTLTADVLDRNSGETQTFVKEFKISDQSQQIFIQVAEELFYHHENTIAIDVEGSSGNLMDVKGQLTIQKLKTPERPTYERLWSDPTLFLLSHKEHQKRFPWWPYADEYKKENWEVEQTLLNQSIQTLAAVDHRIAAQSWAEGDYYLRFATYDSILGDSVIEERYFSIINKQSKEWEVGKVFWSHISSNQVLKGDSIHFYWATAKSKAMVLLRIEQAGKVLDKFWVSVRGKTHFALPVKENYMGDVHYYTDVVLDGQHIHYEGQINVVHSAIQPQIEYLSFRNKLLPGQEERWILKITDQSGKPLSAELLATLYDASLDVFQPNQFNIQTPFIQFPHIERRLNLFDLKDLAYTRGAVSYTVDTITAFDPETFEEALEVVVNEGELEDTRKTKPGAPQRQPKKAKKNAFIREDLNELVFFKPYIRTNKKGQVELEFEMNEALTRWKLLLLGHTKNMEFVQSSQEIITQKEIMVQPNVPRFVRQGDQWTFTAKLTNLRETFLKGRATLEIIDPVTNKPLKIFEGDSKKRQRFELAGNSSTTLQWQLKAPQGLTALRYRIIAKSQKQGDGEQADFPILPDEQLATHSTPLFVEAGQTLQITGDSLFAPLSSRQLIKGHAIDLTVNTSWDAIRSLPYLMEYPYECSEQLMSRYYANTLAAAILQSNPKIKAMFQKWRAADYPYKMKAQSKLLLEESPWTANGEDEEYMRWRLGRLFDSQRIRWEQKKTLNKLSERQSNTGGFAWFNGGRTNRYISQHIFMELEHLRRLTTDQFPVEKTAEMVRGVKKYLDDKVQFEYNDWMVYVGEIGADTNKFELNNLHLQYLYARSMSVRDSATTVAYNFLLEQAWRKRQLLKQSPYLSSMLALTLHRSGRVEEAMQLKDSLLRQATHQGHFLYWKSSKGYYWYQNQIETQCLMIELFAEIGVEARQLQAMKLWLLQQKKDHYWSNTKTTAWAAYALMLGGNWLADGQKPELQVNGKAISIAEQEMEPGTGYLKKELTEQPIERIELTNNNASVPMVGNVYQQYQTPLEEVKVYADSAQPLIRRSYYRVDLGQGEERLIELAEDEALQVGDRVRVRLHLHVPASLEYVHVKDQRPLGLEPTKQLSRYVHSKGLHYYFSPKDASTNYFFDKLSKGNWVLEYDMLVNQKGRYQSGVTMLQCMYAPENTVYDKSLWLEVEK